MTAIDRLRLAYHEAGHAVAAHALGCTVKRVTLHADPEPGDDSEGPHGMCETSHRPGSLSLRDKITIKMAAIEAERRCDGVRPWRHLGMVLSESGSRFGKHDVRELEKQLHCAEMGERMRRGWDVRPPRGQLPEPQWRHLQELRADYAEGARELFADPQQWARVERVAAALLARDELSGRELTALLGASLRVQEYVRLLSERGWTLYSPDQPRDSRGR